MKVIKFSSFPIMSLLVCGSFIVFGFSTAFAQNPYQPNYYTPNQPSRGYMANSTAFKQEIARMEINVVRAGKQMMSITQVPRLQKNDVLKVRMLEEEVSGLKPDQSNWDWTFLVTYINPARNNESDEAVSNEINFRRTGWYREYSFTVPYDSQPIFFLYPKPNYRGKIQKLIGKRYDEIRRIGEKTIDIAGAYAQIGMFLNELQGVLYRNGNGGNGGYGNYGGYYAGYGGYGGNTGYNYNQFAEQTVERLARSFNIQLPSCWQGGYGGYNAYNNYGNYNNYYSGTNQDLVGRIQCVARNIRLEDFDLSVGRLLQQGGILAVSQLQQKYPQIAHWIGIAATAIDFIIKLTRKTPLRIVPTVLSSMDGQRQTYAYQSAYANNFASGPAGVTVVQNEAVKISVFAENQPSDGEFVTAYPIVTHKWQAEPDPEVITLPAPALMDSCLHTGQNILRNTDLSADWVSDAFAGNFKLVIGSPNGFRKEFPLRKNPGMSGWELNVTREDFNAFPKIQLSLQAEIVATRGFNEIRSPKFELPMDIGGTWEISPDSQQQFAVGGKRVIRLRNQFGSCRCLQAVVYKPSFGGQFVFETNGRENPLLFSADGREVSFEIDTTNFQSGAGQLELRQYGGDTTTVNINLYPALPKIADLKIAKGDKQALVTGERLEQIQYLKINGRKAVFAGTSQTANRLVFTDAANAAPGGLTQRIAFFEDPAARQTSVSVILELGLDSGRVYQYPQTFTTTAARPAILTNAKGDIDAVAVREKPSAGQAIKGQVNLPLNAIPLDASEISLNVQNILTDYNFRAENLQIETQIENTPVSPAVLPKASFEVLDWKNLRIEFQLTPELQKYLAGKRLQFRIRDRERGDSDWYTIDKTFVRLPRIVSVTCVTPRSRCEMRGTGLEYISQVSVDGGRTWLPESPAGSIARPAPDSDRIMPLPGYSGRHLLRVRLRDLPLPAGLTVP